jgi:phosphoglucomutase
VSRQEIPDGNFITCPYPNPENIEAFSEALKLAKEKNADIIIATDPDCDRLGVCVKHNGEYKMLSGNEIGSIIFNYILEQRKENKTLPPNAVAVKSIVSTMLVDKIANKYNCEMREVLTGFKNIAAEILKLEKSGRENDYVFGFEESNGYLVGTYSRDKDAVSAVLIICEIASYYRTKNLDLYDVLCDLWNKYGFFSEKTLSFEFDGIEGKNIISNIMVRLRDNFLEEFKGLDISRVYDYLKSEIYDTESKKIIKNKLPLSNILRFDLKNGSKLVVRPSGTEPKIKFYLIVKADSIRNLENCKINIQNVIEKFLLTPYKTDINKY